MKANKLIAASIFLAAIFGCKSKHKPVPIFSGLIILENGTYDTTDQRQIGSMMIIFADSTILMVESDSLIATRIPDGLNIKKK